MPGYQGHTIGALFFCGLLYLFPFWLPLAFPEKLLCVGITVFFGLWPDVDIKSKGQTIFLSGFLIVDAILIQREEYKTASYLGLLIALPIISKHRGWTHNYFAMVLIPVIFYLVLLHYTGSHPLLLLPYFLAALLGYSSHLILDRYF